MIISFRDDMLSPISRRNRIFFALILSVGMVFFFFIHPQHSLLPACYFKSLTGLDCPSCGLSRSFYAVAHFHMGDSFRYHIIGPILFLFFVLLLFKLCIEITFRKALHVNIPRFAVWIILIVFFSGWFIYWIARIS